MTRYLLTLAALLSLGACNSDTDTDTGADTEDTDTDTEDSDTEDTDTEDTDGDGPPGCDFSGYMCYSFTGVAFACSEEAQCAATLTQYQDAGYDYPFTYAPDGWPSGAHGQCSIAGTGASDDYLLLFYAGIPAGDAQSQCTGQGGSWSAL